METATTLLFSLIWSPVVLIVSAFLSRNWVAEWLKRKATHGFDKQLEELKSNLRKSEENISAQLKLRQAEFERLRDNALSGAMNRQAILDSRRLLAVEKLWSAALCCAPFKLASHFIGALNFAEASKEASTNSDFRETFAVLAKSMDISKLRMQDAGEQRPFVSAEVWAYYSAYTGMIMYGFTQLKALELGLRGDLLKSESVDKLVTAALPHFSQFVKDHGASAYYLLLDQMEEKLLDELRRMIEGNEVDESTVARSANILKLAQAVQAEASRDLDKAGATSPQ